MNHIKLNLQALLAVLVICSAAVPAQAQRFYDHDRQWKHGTREGNGMVPDDYLRPVPVSDSTRSAPPFGYVSGRGLQQQTHGGKRRYPVALDSSYTRPTRSSYSRSANTNSLNYANGMGGIDYSQFSASEQQPAQQNYEVRNGAYSYGTTGSVSLVQQATPQITNGRFKY